jgi:hypothetical protein
MRAQLSDLADVQQAILKKPQQETLRPKQPEPGKPIKPARPLIDRETWIAFGLVFLLLAVEVVLVWGKG